MSSSLLASLDGLGNMPLIGTSGARETFPFLERAIPLRDIGDNKQSKSITIGPIAIPKKIEINKL